jgi:hypothetical protein
MRPSRRIMRVAVMAGLAALAFASSARADGDPASDVLVGQTIRVFMTFSAPDKTLEQRLALTTQEATAAGLPIKVAVIANKNDLGAVPQLFGQPQIYAYYLGSELRLWYKGTLLVVMPKGFGVSGPYPKARAHTALADIKLPAHPTAQELTDAADKALRALAAADGHALHGPDHGTFPFAIVGIAMLAAIAGGLVSVSVDRRLHRRTS